MKERFIAYRNIILGYFGKLLPINKKMFYFYSFHGLYNDNPRRISEALHERFPEGIFVWAISEKSREKLPEYIKTVYPNSAKAVILRCKSYIVVDNYWGWSSGCAETAGIKYWILQHLKKKNQFNLCTWHGTPLKRIGLDEPQYKGRQAVFYTTADILCCGSHFIEGVFRRVNQNKINLVLSGTPRNDILFNNQEDLHLLLRKKLKLPGNKRIILFAPTFRDNIDWSGLRQMNELNIENILGLLRNRFGGEWIFVLRLHNSVLKRIDVSTIAENGCVFDGNIGDDMAEYLSITDVLLTDYSGSLFDYALTKKPCFLYCPDAVNYGTVERGLYFELDSLPFPFAIDTDNLYSNITNFDETKYKVDVDRFLDEIGNVEKGNATEVLTNIICEHISL